MFVSSLRPGPRTALLTMMAWGGLAACDLRPLTSGDLFSPHDAGVADLAPREAGEGDLTDAARDDRGAMPDDGATDASTDTAPDAIATDALTTDALPTDAMGPDALTTDAMGTDGAPCGATCGAGTFCNELTGRCQASTGTGMLSGVITDACDGTPLSALMGIAGQHLCAYPGKGAYFFSQLPLGVLEVAIAKDGYLLYTAVVELTERGNVLNAALVRAADPGCTGPRPADVACSCTASACTH